MMTKRMVDVLVVGGGIVGISSALALQERGRRVTVLDPGLNRRRASYGNAGMINRASLFPIASPGLRRNLLRYAFNADPALHIDYRKLWRVAPWLRHFLAAATEAGWRKAADALEPFTRVALAEHARLAKRAGVNDLLDNTGWLRLYRSEKAFARTALEREILSGYRVGFEILSSADIVCFEPALRRPFARAIFYPEMTLVRDPDALVGAYEHLFLQLGGEVIRAEASELTPGTDGWRVAWDGGEVSGSQAVLAAGAWSGRFTRSLGYRFPLAAERGYHRHFHAGEGPGLSRPVHDTGGGCVICPMSAGLRVVSGVELAPRDAPPSRRLIDGAVAAAAKAVALGDALEASPWMGSRPSTPDGLPIIGHAPGQPGLVLAMGHGHIGLSTGPATGQIVADLLSDIAPSIPITPFSPARFGH